MKLRWEAQVQWGALVRVRGRDRQLVVFTTEAGGGWIAAAIELPDGTELDAQQILGDHGHHLIGEGYPDDIVSRRACSAYARKWLAGDEALTECECAELEPELVEMHADLAKELDSSEPRACCPEHDPDLVTELALVEELDS